MSIPPSPTLFVTNLDDGVLKKTECRRALYSLFTLYGKVLDVVHTRNPKTRGTAFVVFRDLAASTAAMRGLDGESFFGRQLKISYAKSTSHATIALTQGPEAVYAIKAGLVSDKGAKLTVSGAQKKLIEDGREKKRGREDEEEEEDSDEEGGPEKKKGKEDADSDAMEEDDSDDEAPAPPAPATAAPLASSEPNSILFIEGLPAEVTTEHLSPLFQQYPGLLSIRLLPSPPNSTPNSGTAFVSYESVVQAGVAKEVLHNFQLAKGVTMKVNFAQKA
ncbi:U1 small nuclear ribonucleoprotein A [Pseudohyphozyma bogoriensis]|nr:U1 small nuclear ribonucleoprotein A [Pseudohyphozyma bogoriensis]